MNCPLLILAASLATAIATFGHGDLHEQIVAITAEIATKPDDAQLYLRRAELHRAHEDWLDAAKDYDRAAMVAPELSAVDLGRGKMLLASGQPAAAITVLDRFIERTPNFPDAVVTRARAKEKIGEHAAAAADYSRAIEMAGRPEPEYYTERAQALAAGGPEQYPAALRGLDEGIAKLGPIVTLTIPAIELELRTKNFDAALARIDRHLANAPRKETWLARRADILSQAGRAAEARGAYESTLAAIDALPVYRKQTKAVLTLRERIESQLKTPTSDTVAPPAR